VNFIDLQSQQLRIRPEIDRRIAAVLAHGTYIMGPEVAELEMRLAAYIGVPYCIGVANGTDALMIALMALGIGHGDEVITAPFTFIATGETIAILGAKPVFVDIEPDTYNIDPAQIEKAITPRTRAIMPVSLYGQCADMTAINAIAKRFGLAVIEDAAQSFGAVHNGKYSGGLSTIGCTSFFPSKPLGGYGDGGACFTSDEALAERMRQIRVHGQDRRYHHPLLGVNGRLDTLQAAILLAKMDIFEDEVRSRERIGQRYTENLRQHVRTPSLRPGNSSVYAQYTIEVEDRATISARLKERGIPTAIHYPLPLSLQPAFSYLGYQKGAFPVSERAADRVLSLPMHPYLTEADQDRVISAVIQSL
jgi:UDP-2-acetamido-2-deoxy-ribo-hexuluronate aminotransferase